MKVPTRMPGAVTRQNETEPTEGGDTRQGDTIAETEAGGGTLQKLKMVVLFIYRKLNFTASVDDETIKKPRFLMNCWMFVLFWIMAIILFIVYFALYSQSGDRLPF